MKAMKAAIALAAIGLVLCLWLLVRVNWYNFSTFMLVAQPLLIIAVLIFAGAVVKALKRQRLL